MINTVIGYFEIQRLLGSGGIGHVYAALDMELGREVALKALLPQFSSDEGFVRRFRAEAASLARLNHPNIATLYSLHRQGPSERPELYLVMELVHGRTLRTILQNAGRLGVRACLAVAAQAAAALSYAHRMGVIHRDIKPTNLMLTDAGLLKVIDFGLARIRGSQRLTQEGNLAGTLAYVAPEQTQGFEGNERSDLYSLACVLYEMLSGAPPFRSDTEYGLIRAHVEAPPEPLMTRIPGVDAGIDAALGRALAKNPDDRFASVDEFAHALGAAAIAGEAARIVREELEATTHFAQAAAASVQEAAAGPSSGFGSAPPAPASHTRSRLLAGVLGGAAAAVVVGGGYLAYHTLLTPHAAPGAQAIRAPAAPVRVATALRPDAGPPPARPGQPARPQPTPPAVHKAVSDPGMSAFEQGSVARKRGDDVEAARLYRLAADQGNASGQVSLGFFYEQGRGGLAKDDGEAARLYRLAADQGNAGGRANLGFFYSEGRGGLAKDDAEAARLFRLAADQGNALGQANLGSFYSDGRGGLAKDDREAVRLNRLAADQGSALGQANLGLFYSEGRGGLPKDDGEAARLYRLAAAAGNEFAQKKLMQTVPTPAVSVSVAKSSQPDAVPSAQPAPPPVAIAQPVAHAPADGVRAEPPAPAAETLTQATPAPLPPASPAPEPSKQTTPRSQTIEGDVESYSADGWPMIAAKVLPLVGIATLPTDQAAPVKAWVKAHGDHLSCGATDAVAYRCLTKQELDLSQAILLNGAARASPDAPEIYRDAEQQARQAKRGIWRRSGGGI